MEETIDSALSYTPVYDDAIARNFENQFSRLKDEYYLDHAGATLYSDTQIKNVADDLCHSLYANPHSTGIAGGVTQDVTERMRYRILSHFHTSPEEYSVIFTSGATASLKLVAETFSFKQHDGNTAYQPVVHFPISLRKHPQNVRNSSAEVLNKSYYGGGTVDVVLSSETFHAKRQVLHQRFEDGTLPFLSIISLRCGFDILSNITMKNITNHVFALARILHHTLLTLHHSNGEPVVKLYSDTDYEDSALQGGIVTFNLMRSNGEYVGYMEVLNMAALFKIHLRTGCFCNPGACQRHLVLSNKEVLQNYDAGYVCGGTADLMHGLEYDREWMVMTSAGACLTQKQHVNLCLLKPIICREKKIMQLKYPGMPPIEVPLEYTSGDLAEAALCQSRVCGHKVEGIDCGSAVSEWLSLALGRPNLRLIKQRSTTGQIKVQKKPELSFSSQAQYLLINEASVLWISNKVPSTEIDKDSMLYRFRGNMIIKGCDAFEELRWKNVRIGKHEFMVNGPCTRCQMICIDQTTGIKTVEPLRTLAEKFHGKLKFGAYLTKLSKEEGIVNKGDAIYFT
ncbi:hypothetical protein KM043_006879 [Ampulex compressa]|nr:hypothetical protein KM043_006879 [Ampulex compressa]